MVISNDLINESKRRDLGRTITGNISEDRIWEQWYSEEAINSELPRMTQKDYLFSCIGDEPDRVIINNRGSVTYTVKEFKDVVELYEKAFYSYGFSVGDVVCTIALTTPELYAIKYAATQIGLITCNLNIFDAAIEENGVNRLLFQIKKCNPKMLFVQDYLEDKVANIINETLDSEIEKVILPLDNSMRISIEKIALRIKRVSNIAFKKNISGAISLNTFLSRASQIKEQIPNVYKEGLPCSIAFTSGTTGTNKAVLISHDAHNAIAFQQKIADFGYKVGTKHLALLPPFLAFWDADVVHTVLCLGGENIIEISLEPEDVKQYFKKYDINLGIWPQYLWNQILDMSTDDFEHFKSNIRQAIIGGERPEINAAKTFVKKVGIFPLAGYGASEVNTTFSVTHPNCNKLGTAGLPLPFNNVKVVDDEMQDVTYGVPGQLLIQSPALMNSYYLDPDSTKEAIYIDGDGGKWYRTGDYGFVDNDGCLTVIDRYMEPVAVAGRKVQLLDLAEKIRADRELKICKMMYIENVLILHVNFDPYVIESEDSAIVNLKNTIQQVIEEELWPNLIVISKELPRTRVGKVDYMKLKYISDEIIKNKHITEKMTVLKL